MYLYDFHVTVIYSVRLWRIQIWYVLSKCIYFIKKYYSFL